MDREEWLIECRRGQSDNMLWWCEDGAGYTWDVDKAGRYTEEQAKKQEKLRPGVDFAHRLLDIQKSTIRVVPR